MFLSRFRNQCPTDYSKRGRAWLDSDPLPILRSFVLLAVFLLLHGFFAAARMTVTKISSGRTDSRVRSGPVKGKLILCILNDAKGYLTVCQVGMIFSLLGMGAVAENAAVRLFVPFFQNLGIPENLNHVLFLLFSFTWIAAVHLILGAWFPETFALRKFEQIGIWSAAPLIVFYKLASPFIRFLNRVSGRILETGGMRPETEREQAPTEEDIRHYLKQSFQTGSIPPREFALIDNVFEFAKTSAKEIMIPRTDLVCLYTRLSVEQNKEIAITSTHTRFPVCDPDKDHIIGYVHIKDLFGADEELHSIRPLARPLMSVPESIPISTLLELMQQRRTEISLLIDEYGGTSGLVTVEDIMEEIVGDIRGEFDNQRPRIEQRDEFTHSVDGRLPIEEVNEYFGLDIYTDQADTIGGWVFLQLAQPPLENQKIVYRGYEFAVDETDHIRIARLTVRRLFREKEQLLQKEVS